MPTKKILVAAVLFASLLFLANASALQIPSASFKDAACVAVAYCDSNSRTIAETYLKPAVSSKPMLIWDVSNIAGQTVIFKKGAAEVNQGDCKGKVITVELWYPGCGGMPKVCTEANDYNIVPLPDSPGGEKQYFLQDVAYMTSKSTGVFFKGAGFYRGCAQDSGRDTILVAAGSKEALDRAVQFFRDDFASGDYSSGIRFYIDQDWAKTAIIGFEKDKDSVERAAAKITGGKPVVILDGAGSGDLAKTLMRPGKTLGAYRTALGLGSPNMISTQVKVITSANTAFDDSVDKTSLAYQLFANMNDKDFSGKDVVEASFSGCEGNQNKFVVLGGGSLKKLLIREEDTLYAGKNGILCDFGGSGAPAGAPARSCAGGRGYCATECPSGVANLGQSTCSLYGRDMVCCEGSSPSAGSGSQIGWATTVIKGEDIAASPSGATVYDKTYCKEEIVTSGQSIKSNIGNYGIYAKKTATEGGIIEFMSGIYTCATRELAEEGAMAFGSSAPPGNTPSNYFRQEVPVCSSLSENKGTASLQCPSGQRSFQTNEQATGYCACASPVENKFKLTDEKTFTPGGISVLPTVPVGPTGNVGKANVRVCVFDSDSKPISEFFAEFISEGQEFKQTYRSANCAVFQQLDLTGLDSAMNILEKYVVIVEADKYKTYRSDDAPVKPDISVDSSGTVTLTVKLSKAAAAQAPQNRGKVCGDSQDGVCKARDECTTGTVVDNTNVCDPTTDVCCADADKLKEKAEAERKRNEGLEKEKLSKLLRLSKNKAEPYQYMGYESFVREWIYACIVGEKLDEVTDVQLRVQKEGVAKNLVVTMGGITISSGERCYSSIVEGLEPGTTYLYWFHAFKGVNSMIPLKYVPSSDDTEPDVFEFQAGGEKMQYFTLPVVVKLLESKPEWSPQPYAVVTMRDETTYHEITGTADEKGLVKFSLPKGVYSVYKVTLADDPETYAAAGVIELTADRSDYYEARISKNPLYHGKQYCCIAPDKSGYKDIGAGDVSTCKEGFFTGGQSGIIYEGTCENYGLTLGFIPDTCCLCFASHEWARTAESDTSDYDRLVKGCDDWKANMLQRDCAESHTVEVASYREAATYGAQAYCDSALTKVRTVFMGHSGPENFEPLVQFCESASCNVESIEITSMGCSTCKNAEECRERLSNYNGPAKAVYILGNRMTTTFPTGGVSSTYVLMKKILGDCASEEPSMSCKYLDYGSEPCPVSKVTAPCLQYPGTYTGGKSQGLSSQPSGTAYRKCCYISPERTTVRSDFSPPNTEYSLLSAWQVANGPDDTCPDFCVPLTYHAPGGDSVSVIATLSQTLPVFECKPQGDSNMVCYTRSCNGNTVLEAKKVVPVSTDPLTAVAA